MFTFSAEFQRRGCVCVWIKIQCQNKVIQEDEGRFWAVMWAQLLMAFFFFIYQVVFPARKKLTFPLFTHLSLFYFFFWSIYLFYFFIFVALKESHRSILAPQDSMSWGLIGRSSSCLKHWMLYHLIMYHFIFIILFSDLI